MSITSANTIFMLAVAGLFDTPQQIQGFAADDIFSAETVAPAEVLMGVDGKLSGGFVNTPRPQGVSLQADSLSNDFFDAWVAAQAANLDVFPANGIVSWPSLRRKWTLTKGFLTAYPPMPSAGKLLQPRKYTITWESVVGAPI